jgi:MoxR-like ATPase
MKIDKDLAAQLEAEYNTLMGNSVDVEPEAEPEPEPEPSVSLPTLEPHAAWPAHAMFSDVFAAEEWLKTEGMVDLPVPQFKPDDWPAEARAMIPALPSYWHHNKAVMYGIAQAVYNGDTTLLTGATGTGKTSALFAFAAECGIPVWLTSCYERMEHTDFVGSASLRADAETGANITEYNPTQLVNSLRYGGMSVVDEAFRSPTLMAIQPLLEDRHTLVLADADGLEEHERVLTGEDGKWWIMLTDNTTGTGDHTGNYNAVVQDLSTLDRITSTLAVPYNPRDVEIEIMLKAVPSLPRHMATNMVNVAHEVRSAFERGTVLQTMSMRALLSWARKWSTMHNLNAAFKQSFYSKLDPESRGVVAEIWQQVMATEL